MATNSLSRRAALRTMTAAGLVVSAAVPAGAITAEPDPVYQAIECHKAANAAYGAACDAMTDQQSQKFASRCGAEHGTALAALLGTCPTTAAGCVAMLAYLGELLQTDDQFFGDAPFNEWREDIASAGLGFLPMVAKALARTLGAAS